VYSDAVASDSESLFMTAVADIARNTATCISAMCETTAQAIAIQSKTASDLVLLGLQQVINLLASAVVAHLGSDTSEPRNTPAASSTVVAALANKKGPFEAASNVLSVLKMAEDTLADHVSGSRGAYKAALQGVFEVIQEQSRMAVAHIEEVNQGELASVMAKLLFLVQVRSSSLRKHFNDAAVLDNLYEEPVQKVVCWHEQVVEVVLKAAKKDSTSFTEQIAVHRVQVELSMKLSALADVESIQSLDAGTGTINSPKWAALKGRRDELVKHIGIATQSFALKAEAKLDEHKRAVSSKNQDLIEKYEYTEHSKDLAILEGALWCDSILATDGEDGNMIETCILKLWHAFEEHMLLLAQGEEGVLSRLNAGKHKQARTLLVQLHSMEQLWKGGRHDKAASDLLSEGACGADIARRLAKIHDDARQTTNAMLVDKCEKVRAKVLFRQGPAWMDASVKDANVIGRQGALGHLDAMLDLASELLPASGPNSLEGWLDLDEMESTQTECRNVAHDFKDKLRNRVKLLFNGLSACELQLIDDAVRKLSGSVALRELFAESSLPANVSLDHFKDVHEAQDKEADSPGETDVKTDGKPPPPSGAHRQEHEPEEPVVKASQAQTAEGQQRPDIVPPPPVAEQMTTSPAQVTAACEEVMAILRLLCRPSAYPGFFAAMREEADPSSVSDDDRSTLLTPFYELVRLYQSAHIDSISTFTAPETEAAARLKALSIFRAISEITPDNEMFQMFRKSHEQFYPTLIKTSQEAGNRINQAIKAAFASCEFTDETYDTMKQLERSRSHDNQAGRAYQKACSLLSDNVRTVISLITMGFTYMQHPEQGFVAQDHLVKPWSKLQAARSHSCFLMDAASDTPLNLDVAVEDLLGSFRSAFAERVLQPLIDKFDLGFYSDAEGLRSYGLSWVSGLVRHLQNAQCALGEVAREALDEKRKYQRAVLAKPPCLPSQDAAEVASIAPTGEDTSEREGPTAPDEETLKRQPLSDRVHVLDRWFQDCYKRSCEMNLCTRDTELAREYSSARDAIDDEVRRTLHKEFDHLLSKEFLSETEEHVEYLEKLQLTIVSSSYAAGAKQCVDLEAVKAQIKNWESAQHLNPVTFVELPHDKQAEMIKSTDPRKPEYQEYVRNYHAAHQAATQRAEKLLVSADAPPGKLSEAFEELRGRASKVGLSAVNLDYTKQAALEEKALSARQKYETQTLTGALQNIPPEGKPREMWDMDFKQQLTRWLDLVKVARAPPPGSSAAKQIMAEVNTILQNTVEQSEGSVDSARQAAITAAALARLKCWAPSESAAGVDPPSADQGIFQIVAELEAALADEGSIDARMVSAEGLRARVKPGSDISSITARNGNTTAQISSKVSEAHEALQRSFDPKKDVPLDPQPFETLFSVEMATLIQNVCPEVEAKIKELKSSVEAKAQSHYEMLKSSLEAKNNMAASAVFDEWKYLEPVASLAAFTKVPGETAFNEELKKHSEKLAMQAQVSIRVAGAEQLFEVAKPIIILAKFGSDISRASKYAGDAINDVLSSAEAKFHVSGMQSLAIELRKIDPALGNEVVSSSDSFKTLTIAEFNQKTKRDISKVKQLFSEKNPLIGDQQVWRKYEEFKGYYDRYLQRCIEGTVGHIADPLAFLVNEARAHVSSDKAADRDLSSRLGRFTGLTSHNQQEIPKVLAAIFAWWTIEFYLKIKKKNASVSKDAAKLRQANNVQVVCILRLLGATSNSSLVDVKNHLAEVLTGEGKSVTIGVLATTLALYGYHVDCVCYSSMLSQRDEEDFKSMFESFGLKDKIRYGTFDTLSEDLLKERHGDLRALATASLAQKHAKDMKSVALPKRVLIVDEVDVFCSPTFLGGSFCPVAEIKGPEVIALLRHIWSLRHIGRLDLNTVVDHESYRCVLESGLVSADNAWFLRKAVGLMHEAAKSRPTRKYILRNGRLAYKVDGRNEYSTNFVYTWESNAAYFYAFESGEITEEQLTTNLSLWVSCGTLAYARLPKAFEHILGVTGTLDESKLPPNMHDVLKSEVGIEHFTYCPSMYHAQKRDWEPTDKTYMRLAADEDEHFNLIADEIQSRLKPLKKVDDQRSVIVFFHDIDELNRFRDSSYFSGYRNMAGVLSEITAMTPESCDSIIKAATRQGMVTLSTRAFGRGTDFKIFDDRMEDCGGMHVMQTFFSHEISEEVQIQGRCARQGHTGSYSMVLKIGSLVTKFKLRETDVKAWPSNEVYAKLCQIRNQEALKEVTSLRRRAKEWKQAHDETVAAIAGGPTAMARFVRKQNQ